MGTSDEELREVMGKLGYMHLLENPVEEWSALTPLPGYATEYLPSWHQTKEKKVITLNSVNGENLVRTKELHTKWMEIKKSLGLLEKKSGGKDEVGEEHKKNSAKGEDEVRGEQAMVGESRNNDRREDGKQDQGASENDTGGQVQN